MSFLQPWLWLGAAATLVPLWLHLRARTGEVVFFPAVRFLEDQPRPRVRGFRLRDALLLAMRLLGLLLLVGAFSRPFARDAVPVTETRVHVLDNTFSQQVDGGFERDRGQVVQEIEAASPGVQTAVIELTGRPRVVAGFADGREETLRRLRALRPSFQRGSYLEAFRLADSLFEQSLGARRVLRVHADQQENQWAENESTPPFLDAVAVQLGRTPDARARDNVSLGESSARFLFIGEDTYVDLAVPLRHQGPARRAVVALEANGRRVLERELALVPPAGIVTLEGQWRADPTVWLQGKLILENTRDALPADDVSYFCLPPVREGRVGLLARSPYLRAALAPEVSRGRWSTRSLDPGDAARLAQASEKDLADVLVVESDQAQSEQVRELVFRHLNNGRGVLLVLNRTTPLLRPFLRELGIEAAGPGAPAPGAQGFRSIAGDHPIFRPFARGELGDLAEPRVFRYLPLKLRDGVPLVYGAAGDPLLVESTGTKGRLLVFAFSLDRAGSDWPLHPTFIPFLDLALQHARSATAIETSALPGALHTHEVAEGPLPREVVLRGEGPELLRVPVDEHGRARLQAPDQPGLYSIGYDGGPEMKGMIAVNPSPKESELSYVSSPAAVTAWVLPEATPAATPPPAAPRAAADASPWPWRLLLGGALLFFAESLTLVARRQAA
jgi:hypothetical protein